MCYFFGEGPESEVFPSEITNYYIKMNFIHATNIGVYFESIYRVPGTCWA